MDEEKKSSLLGSIFKDCVDTILIPKSKEIATNVLVDGFYAVADTLSNYAQRKIWKDQSHQIQTRSKPNQPTGYSNRFQQVNGNKVSSSPTQPPQQNIGMRSSADLQYVVAPSQEKAEQWKQEMLQSIKKFGRVCVNELYEKEGNIKPIFSDFDYGWTRPEDIHYVRNRDGWWFNLPRPEKVK